MPAADKRPATANGLRDATTDLDIIRQWWRQEPQFNLAIATGAVSGIFVVDVDGLDAEVELRRLEAETVDCRAQSKPSLRAADTFIFARRKYQCAIRPARSRLGSMCAAMAATSWRRRPFTRAAGVMSGRSIVQVALAEAPAVAKIDRISEPATGVTLALPPEAWRELVANGAVEGTRDCTIAKLAGHLLRRRIDPFVALELLQTWNATRCVPPLPAADIERVVASVAGRELRRRADA